MPLFLPIIVFVLICSALSGLASLFCLAFFYHKITRYLALKRERQLVALRSYHGRLSMVISELLSRANEIDQQSKYLPAETDAEWGVVFQKLGKELVLMGDSLTIVHEHIRLQDVKASREVTLLICRKAVQVSRQLLAFEEKVLICEREQIEKIKSTQNEISTRNSSTTSGGEDVEVFQDDNTSKTVDSVSKPGVE
jgi:hypothetical protein